MMIYLGGDFHLATHHRSPLHQPPRKTREKHFFYLFFYRKREKFFQTLTGSRASLTMLVMLECDAELGVVAGIDSAPFCSLLRASSQTFSTPLPLGCCWFACWLLQDKLRYHYLTIDPSFNINCSPDTAGAVCSTVPVFHHAIFVFARLRRTRCVVVMLFSTGCKTLSEWTLNGKVAAGLRLEMSVVYLHLHDSHELNLTGKLLDLLLRGEETN